MRQDACFQVLLKEGAASKLDGVCVTAILNYRMFFDFLKIE